MDNVTSKDLEAIEVKLLSFLQDHYNDDSIEYRDRPQQIFAGFESRVYKFRLNIKDKTIHDFMILRINHPTYDQESFFYDTEVQKALALTSIPVAKVHVASDDISIFNGSFVIMDCIAGHVMWEEAAEVVPSMLADTHVAIHNCDLRALKDYLGVQGYLDKCLFDPIGVALENLQIKDKSIEKWLYDNQPELPNISICHGDFHPNNVLVKDKQVNGILDWHFSLGEAEHDVALTVNILTINSKLHVEESEWEKLDDFTDKYLRAYKKKRSLNPDKLDYYTVVHCLRDLGQGLKRGGKYRTAPYRVNKQLELIEKITGIKLEL
ncbi:hypothetical protein EZV73_27665 [Acidaminobacter sp. JC074]|uniref:phosphotransferase family protein n=1 Tax=Acidaminobacter sp. JC074 TaxID=2530199 RepID=UPI001F0FBE4E|nr:phosphotransferase [Acidaminobacter sp. JC074]MCH4891380.1 hypothetical protein [Acidaminobacter sp. JC074]